MGNNLQKTAPPRWNPPWGGEGAYLTKRFHPSASTSRAHRSVANTSDKDKQICFMLMPRTWFKMSEFRLEEPLDLSYLFVTWQVYHVAVLYPISIYIIFLRIRYIISFSLQFFGRMELRLWRWNMTDSEMEMKELGRSP